MLSLMHFRSIRMQVLLLIVLIPILSACSSPISEKALIGEWRGSLQNKQVIIHFLESGEVELTTRDTVSGEETLTEGNYVADFTKRPIPLSIKNSPQLNHSLHTIIEFEDTASMRMVRFSPKWKFRPVSFGNNN